VKEDWYPELSYSLIGLAYDVFNQLGYGYHEKYYQRAYAQELTAKELPFKKEQLVKIQYNGQSIGRYFMDFVIDDKVVVEWKVASEFYGKHIKQVLAYLRATNLHLGLIILCAKEGIRIKRIAN